MRSGQLPHGARRSRAGQPKPPRLTSNAFRLRLRSKSSVRRSARSLQHELVSLRNGLSMLSWQVLQHRLRNLFASPSWYSDAIFMRIHCALLVLGGRGVQVVLCCCITLGVSLSTFDFHWRVSAMVHVNASICNILGEHCGITQFVEI